MKYAKRNLIGYIIQTCVGAVALIFGLFVETGNDYRDGILWGITGAFLATGIVGIVTTLRLMKNPEKARAIEIAKNEERTQLIRMKTHAAIYYVTLYIICGTTILFGLLGYKEISLTLAALLVVQLVLYVAFANHYAKKY